MTKKQLTFPNVTIAEVESILLKSQTIQLRISREEKEEVRQIATLLNLSVSEYLLKTHRLIADKVKRKN